MRRWMMLLAGLAIVVAACGGDDAGADGDDGARETEQADGAPGEDVTATTSTTAPAPPRVVYEVTGAGTVVVDYTTADDALQSREVTLPWSEEQADEPSRLDMLVMLTGSQGDVTCRIRRGDEVLAEQTMATGAGPMVACNYPPSGLPPVTYPPGM